MELQTCKRVWRTFWCLNSNSLYRIVGYHFEGMQTNPATIKKQFEEDLAAYRDNMWRIMWIAVLERTFMLLCKFLYSLREYLHPHWKWGLHLFPILIVSGAVLWFFNSQWWRKFRVYYRIVNVFPYFVILCASSWVWSWNSWSSSQM